MINQVQEDGKFSLMEMKLMSRKEKVQANIKLAVTMGLGICLHYHIFSKLIRSVLEYLSIFPLWKAED